jgi:hypothetical protein
MRTHVQQDMYFPLAISRDNDLIATHVTNDEVARRWDLSGVRQQEPSFSEDLLHLDFVYFVIAEDTYLYFSTFEINELLQLRSIS